MGRLLLIILISFGNLYSYKKLTSLFDDDFKGTVLIYNSDVGIVDSINFDPDDKLPLASISKNIYAAFALWLSETSGLYLDADIRSKFHLLSHIKNEITFIDLLTHSSGIYEGTIHEGGDLEAYPGLEYNYNGLNYSLLKNILLLEDFDYYKKFDEFKNQLGVSKIRFITKPEEFEIERENFLIGSSDLYSDAITLLSAISEIDKSDLIRKELLYKVNFTLDDSTRKTLFGDKIITSNGKEAFLLSGKTTDFEIYNIFIPEDNTQILFYGNGIDFYSIISKILDDGSFIGNSNIPVKPLYFIIPVLIILLIIIGLKKRK